MLVSLERAGEGRRNGDGAILERLGERRDARGRTRCAGEEVDKSEDEEAWFRRGWRRCGAALVWCAALGSMKGMEKQWRGVGSRLT